MFNSEEMREMAAKALDFWKLGKVKQEIISKAYAQGYVGKMTYGKEKDALKASGWLSYGELGTRWYLSPEGRAAYEAHKNAETWQQLADADPTIKELLTPTNQTDLNAALGAGQHHNKGMLEPWAKAESKRQNAAQPAPDAERDESYFNQIAEQVEPTAFVKPIRSPHITTQLQNELDAAAKTLAKFDPPQRVGWICWLFEALEDETKGEDYDFGGTLVGTIEALKERLVLGGW